MTVVLVALVVGGVVGLATGGSLRTLTTVRLRSTWLLVGGALGQGAAGLIGSRTGAGATVGFALIVVSYLALAGFAMRNIVLTGMGIVTLGIALNLAPILADRGMPVEGPAIVRARIAPLEEVPMLRYGAKRHLAHPGDHLRVLDDSIPEWVNREVVSIGDIVIGVGAAAVIAALLRPRRGQLRARRSSGGESPGAGPDRRASG